MNRGDVVIVDWPYSDLSGSKLRPAVVVITFPIAQALRKLPDAG